MRSKVDQRSADAWSAILWPVGALDELPPADAVAVVFAVDEPVACSETAPAAVKARLLVAVTASFAIVSATEAPTAYQQRPRHPGRIPQVLRRDGGTRL